MPKKTLRTLCCTDMRTWTHEIPSYLMHSIFCAASLSQEPRKVLPEVKMSLSLGTTVPKSIGLVFHSNRHRSQPFQEMGTICDASGARVGGGAQGCMMHAASLYMWLHFSSSKIFLCSFSPKHDLCYGSAVLAACPIQHTADHCWQCTSSEASYCRKLQAFTDN
jgi:hypothetical protein